MNVFDVLKNNEDTPARNITGIYALRRLRSARGSVCPVHSTPSSAPSPSQSIHILPALVLLREAFVLNALCYNLLTNNFRKFFSRLNVNVSAVLPVCGPLQFIIELVPTSGGEVSCIRISCTGRYSQSKRRCPGLASLPWSRDC
jgi:hypothetical protein